MSEANGHTTEETPCVALTNHHFSLLPGVAPTCPATPPGALGIAVWRAFIAAAAAAELLALTGERRRTTAAESADCCCAIVDDHVETDVYC